MPETSITTVFFEGKKKLILLLVRYPANLPSCWWSRWLQKRTVLSTTSRSFKILQLIRRFTCTAQFESSPAIFLRQLDNGFEAFLIAFSSTTRLKRNRGIVVPTFEVKTTIALLAVTDKRSTSFVKDTNNFLMAQNVFGKQNFIKLFPRFFPSKFNIAIRKTVKEKSCRQQFHNSLVPWAE